VWLRLLASRPPLSWEHWLRILSVTALAPVNSLANLLESLVFERRIARTVLEHPPVFILGHWRSGTTLLHNLMALDPGLTFPNLYQVLAPRHFLLTEQWVTRLTGHMVPKTRPMDSMPAGWGLPQEDEAALLLMTLLSPYLMTVHPQDSSVYSGYFEPGGLPPEELQEWKEALLYFLKKLTLRANRPVVLKSPTHTRRIPLLLEMFPGARFVHVCREPYAVYSSTVHLRHTMAAVNGLGRASWDGLEADVLGGYMDCFERYQQDKHLIPAGRLCEVRFESLEADPLGEMRRVYAELGMEGWSQVEPRIEGQLPDLKAHRKNRHTLDPELMRRIYSVWKPAFERYGYPSQIGEGEGGSRSKE